MSDDFAVLGLDLSLTATGICPYISEEGDEPYSIKFGSGKFAPKGDYRLCKIRDAIETEIDSLFGMGGEYDLAVVEGLPPYAKGSASLGLVHGVVRELLSRYNIKAILVDPSPLKKFATGVGTASKVEMIAAFNEVSPWNDNDFDDNAVDAWFLQQVGFAYLHSDQLVVKPKGYDVLAKVRKIK